MKNLDCERLEPRRMLSAGLSHGVLTISGSSKVDRIYVDLVSGASGLTLLTRINGDLDAFTASKVKFIRVDAGSGSDHIKFTSGDNGWGIHSLIYCGAGNDSVDLLVGGGAVIYGQKGNDRIQATSSKDMILGGPGNDLLSGRGGNDRLLG